MGNRLELLEAEALTLSPGERAAFAQVLLASLDDDIEIDAAWAAEAEQRIDAIERGLARPVPLADALTKIRATLR
jgi:putative addiction module component (TIGR02574 family)